MADMHDEERGEGESGSATATQYGSAERVAYVRTSPSRGWALGGVLLCCALVGAVSWAHNPDATSELLARGRKFVGLVDVTPSQTTSKIDPPDPFVVSKGSFVKGEATMAKAIFAEDSSKDELQDVVYSLVHPEMLQELQHEIENEMEQEVQEAVKKEQQEYYLGTTAQVQKEMEAVMSDVDWQKKKNKKFSGIVSRAKEVEGEVCKGVPCDNWSELLAGAQKKVDALTKELDLAMESHRKSIFEMSEKDKNLLVEIAADEEKARKLEEDLKYWHGLANVYYAMIHAPHNATEVPVHATHYADKPKVGEVVVGKVIPPPALPPPIPPPPPHCSGITTIYGHAGTISSGPAGSAKDRSHIDCRWIIKSPDSSIVLRFPNLKVMGSGSRVSVFVGPENVRLYKDQDMLNWALAFKSFTGMSYEAPIVCNSNEVLVVFQNGDENDAKKNELDLTWTSGVKASAKALFDNALTSIGNSRQELANWKKRQVY